jgi:hypothetical protein
MASGSMELTSEVEDRAEIEDCANRVEEAISNAMALNDFLVFTSDPLP